MSHRPRMIAPQRYLFDVESRWPELERLIGEAKALEAENFEQAASQGDYRELKRAWPVILAINYTYAKGFFPAAARRPDGSVDLSAIPGGSLGPCLDMANDSGKVPDMDDVALFDLWPSWKMVYRFDANLAQELAESRWAERTPCSDLERLPAGCFYVQAPMVVVANLQAKRRSGIELFRGGGPVECDGFFAWTCPIWLERPSGREFVENLCLRFVTSKGEPVGFLSVSLDLGTLEEGIDEDVRYFTPRGADRGLMERFRIHQLDLAHRACSLLLYLASFQSELEDVGRTKRQRKAQGSRRIGDVGLVDVGVRLGAAIGRYRSEEASREEALRMRVRPHVRRGHFHHYWTGPRGRREKVLRWVHPVMVNEGRGMIETTVHEVHGAKAQWVRGRAKEQADERQ